MHEVSPAYELYPVEIHYRGPNWAGFRFGSGDLLARIYSKTVQACTDYGAKLTLAGYGNPEGHVIRVEFQIRGDALATMDVGAGDLRSWSALAEHLPAIWRYLTGSWLSLREASDTETIRNRPLDPLWGLVLSAFDAPDSASTGQVVRCARAPLANVTQLLTQAIGCIVSAAASLGLHHHAPAPSVLLAWLRRVRYLVGVAPEDLPALDKARFNESYSRAWYRYAGATV